jgi:hypothetical protein
VAPADSAAAALSASHGQVSQTKFGNGEPSSRLEGETMAEG